ncbi:MAG: bifunctional diaminohydroxyphosphoribosylaminopyrimidine deaminase/5-amino-6-(5-phosphoribosylamino)uracil reductase RibD [Ignavibacteria bacterium]|nr:bifunctional diaminohydroxyphosphoribosylaminopyrimidine deaminase/5-amino-6-(5-phosphoribosylamino)uracil reductase RibD [Ignavibacteria bacterium]
MSNNEKYILKCINLATNGLGRTSPNPLVGCIIVKNNRIIGRGYHKYYGGAHAEINAINDALKRKENLEGSTLYVNLEPCCHYGKTPPCTNEIIKNKIKNVVIGMEDPNPLVSGKGIKQLRNAGIKVEYGIKKDECIELNKTYIKNICDKLPYVSLKIAQSIDGKISLTNNESKWITNPDSRKYVKKLRNQYDAILIGHNTALLDNPSLLPEDLSKIPYRIVLSDTPEKLPATHKLFSDKYSSKTLILFSEISKKGYRKILKTLYRMNIYNILVEGGAFIFSKFIEYKLFDDIFLFVANKIIGKGISPFEMYSITNLKKTQTLKLNYSKRIQDDLLIYYKKG